MKDEGGRGGETEGDSKSNSDLRTASSIDAEMAYLALSLLFHHQHVSTN